MERLGVSLVDVLKRNRLQFSYEQVISLGVQIISSIEQLHDLGYVHCDLKPDNILFGLQIKKRSKNKSGQPRAHPEPAVVKTNSGSNPEFFCKIIDFGLCHSFLEEA